MVILDVEGLRKEYMIHLIDKTQFNIIKESNTSNLATLDVFNNN